MQKEMLGKMLEFADPINSGLVLYYRFNEGMGDHVSDLSLNDNHGTLENFAHSGTPTSGWTPGFRGKTLAFDDVNDYIDCGNNNSLNPTKSIAISIWLKPTLLTLNRPLIFKGQSPFSYYVWLTTAGTISWSTTGLSDPHLAVSDDCLTLNVWQHLCFTYDGTSKAIYHNGVLIASEPATGSISTAGNDLYIGRFGSSYFKGSIDEVRIYNRALSQSEIFRLVMEGSPAITPKGQAYPNYFVFDCATTGAAETFTLPLESSGTYDFEVHWGDGTWDIITAWNAAAATHTYTSAGTHQIVIDGHIEGWRFNESASAPKIRDISSWGCLLLGNNDGYFNGCTGLTVSATDILNLNGTINLYRMFRDCTSLTTVPSMNNWDISNVTNLGGMFVRAILFNNPLDNWDTSNVANMGYMFYYAYIINQNIGSWDITALTAATNMFTLATLSTANYDALLIGWEAQVELPNVNFDGGASQYSSGAAATARAALEANGWVITDGGQV